MEDFKRVEPVAVRDFKTSAHLLTEFMCSEQSSTFRSLHSLLFRGEPSAKFSLIPSALRPEKQNEFCRLVEAAGLIVGNGGRPMNEHLHITCELQLIKYFYKTANQKGMPLPPLPYKANPIQVHILQTYSLRVPPKSLFVSGSIAPKHDSSSRSPSTFILRNRR